MSNPLPHNAKQRAEDRMTKDANTLFKLAILESDQIKGRHGADQASKVIGAGAAYPPSAGPWSANAPRPGQEPFIDGRDPAPVVGEPHEIERADKLAKLRHERNRCFREQTLIDAADPRVDDWQARRDAIEAEIVELERKG